MTNDNGRVNGPTILLSSGRYLDVDRPLSPPPTIEDVAWGLASRCRWSGQCISKHGTHLFYSVAQHCVLMSLMMSISGKPHLAYPALMHELDEFVWGDLSGPLKVKVPDFVRESKETGRYLAQYFGVQPHDAVELKIADKRMMATERRDLMGSWSQGDYWSYMGDAEPYDMVIEPWSFERSADAFLDSYKDLRRGL